MPSVDVPKSKKGGLLTTAELAQKLGCSTRTLRRYLADGIIEPVRVNSNHHLYRWRDTLLRLHRRGYYEHIPR